MPWYSGTTLLTALEGAEPTSHVAERAFRMPVQLVARPDHTFRGYAGTVATGTIRPGAAVVNAVSGTEAKVSRIVTMDGDLPEAIPGDAVTLVLDREIDVSRGDVLAMAPPPALADQVTARVVWMDETPLFRGRAYLVMLGSRSVIGTITEITNRLDVDTLAEVPVRELGLNEIGTRLHFTGAAGAVRALRGEPRTGRVYPDRSADAQHRRRRDGDRTACERHQPPLAPRRRG